MYNIYCILGLVVNIPRKSCLFIEVPLLLVYYTGSDTSNTVL